MVFIFFKVFFLTFKNIFNFFTFFLIWGIKTKEYFVTCENYMIFKFQCPQIKFTGTQPRSLAVAGGCFALLGQSQATARDHMVLNA